MPLTRVGFAIPISIICCCTVVVALLALSSPNVLATREHGQHQRWQQQQRRSGSASSSSRGAAGPSFAVAVAAPSTVSASSDRAADPMSSLEEGEIREEPSDFEEEEEEKEELKNVEDNDEITAAPEKLPPGDILEREVQKVLAFEKSFTDGRSALVYLKAREWICPREANWEELKHAFDKFLWTPEALASCKLWMEVEEQLVRWLHFLQIYHDTMGSELVLVSNLALFPAILFNKPPPSNRQHKNGGDDGPSSSSSATTVQIPLMTADSGITARKKGNKKKSVKRNPPAFELNNNANDNKGNQQFYSTVGLVEKLSMLKRRLQQKRTEAMQIWSKKEVVAVDRNEIDTILALSPSQWPNRELCGKLEKLVTYFNSSKPRTRKRHIALKAFLTNMLRKHKDVLMGIETRIVIQPMIRNIIVQTGTPIVQPKPNCAIIRKYKEEDDDDDDEDYEERPVKKKPSIVRQKVNVQH